LCSHISNYLDWILVSKGRVFWCHIKDPYWDNKKIYCRHTATFPSAGLKLQGRGSPLWCRLGTTVNLWLSKFKVNDLTQTTYALCTPKKIHEQNLYAKFSDWELTYMMYQTIYTSVGQLLSKHPVINKVINNLLSRYWVLEDWVENLPFW
jgi:hypothetical protein